MNIKQETFKLLLEADNEFLFGLPDYGGTGSLKKSKFQIGDEVLVDDPQNRWYKYPDQRKASKEAIGQLVTIIGYKYVPGRYSKYAIKLSNGNIYGIHSHFLRKLTEEEIKMRALKQKLPELEGIF